MSSLRILVPFLAFGLAFASHAQDLIVLQNGDSLNCKIRGSDGQGVHYTYLFGDKLQEAYASHQDVRYVQKRFYTQRYQGEKRMADLRGHALFRASVHGGVGWYTGQKAEDLPDWLQEHNESLRFAPFLGADAHLFFAEGWAVGACVSTRRTAHTTPDVTYFLADSTTVMGELTNDMRLTYVGPSLLFRRSLAREGLDLVFTASVGYLWYRDEGVAPEPLTIRGGTYGARFTGGVEYRTGSGIGAHLFAALSLAQLNNATLDGDPIGRDLIYSSDVATDLGRFEVGVGLTFSH